MLFGYYDRYQYRSSPLIEVICQLRFPTILSIGAQAPAAFQEAIRHDFPRYMARQEQPTPRVKGARGPAPKLETPPTVTNYNFVSTDGLWKLNLTQDFIALSTLRYSRWEEFAQQLDKPLAAFIQLYQPAFFQRIGLRYVNAFSRKMLELEGTPWSTLIQPAFLGVLAEPDVEESAASRSSVDTQMTLSDGSHMKLHAGPGQLNGGKQDPETKFVLDGDFSVGGSLSADRVPGTLEGLHQHAVCLFRGAVTSDLHTAMGPRPLT